MKVAHLMRLQKAYFAYRKYRIPNALESAAWLVTEVGELVEALLREYPQTVSPELTNHLLAFVRIAAALDNELRQEKGWVRNNPDPSQSKPLEPAAAELGDVLMMLLATADAMGVDPAQEMSDKMARKGLKHFVVFGHGIRTVNFMG